VTLLRRLRADAGRRWFLKQQKKRLFIFALETTVDVKPHLVPGVHRSYVNESGNRVWAFRDHSDYVMARRIAGDNIIERKDER